MKTSYKKYNHIFCKLIMLATTFIVFYGCKKFVTVNELKDSMLSNQVFNTNTSANAAILGIYNTLEDVQASTAFNVFSSLSSDDMIYLYPGGFIDDFYKNTLTSANSYVPWSTPYNIIYQANAALEGLQASSGIEPGKKTQFIAEAKFIRAYVYFYLTNFFGDVPLLLSTDVVKNATASRTSSEEIYALIVSDLLDAEVGLPSDFSIGSGSKTRANKWAAKALLARVYLYQKKYDLASEEATGIIDTKFYSLLDGPAGIFNRNNSEAIFQLDRYNGEPLTLLNYFTPALSAASPACVCTSSLVSSFEINDLRKSSWLFPVNFLGKDYLAAYKFRVKDETLALELETPLRLAEQYLIRAEAKAMLNDLSAAIADVNLVRLKHGGLSTGLPVPPNQEDAMIVIMRERRVELFSEASHRWFDLKRTGKINDVMQIEKSATWKNSSQLYPIPLTDVQRNPSLKQNPDYQ